MILIVDDHIDTGKVLRLLLKYAGHEALVATSGADALEMLKRRTPDLVVLDVDMPGMDGITVLERIRAQAMFSADQRPEVAEHARGLGAVEFISKVRLGFDKLVPHLYELATMPSA